MKYKIMGIVGLICVFCCTIVISAMDSDNANNRIHQHLTSRQPDAGCDCDGTELCTHLPLVVIDTGGEEIPGEPAESAENSGGEETFSTTASGDTMLSVKISLMEKDDTNHHISDTPDLESTALIRVRGNSSRYFDKKNYLLRFTDENGQYEEHEVMGMDAHYEWALHGPYLDKSLIRNYMWYNIAGEIMDYAPNVRFCEVVLNGEYKGLYVMTETITNGTDCRVNISEPLDDSTETGYVLRLDRGSTDDLKNIYNFTYYTYRIGQIHDMKIDIKYPRSGVLTEAMADDIEQDLSDFEKALYSFDYDTYDYGYQNWIDVQSFVDYFIINEFTCNYDAGSLSTYIYKDIGGKYKMCIWDFNSACDNYQESVTEPQHFEMQDNVWYYMLCKDENFTERIIDRYFELRESYLSDDYINEYMDAVIEYLGPAVERNFEVWGYTWNKYMINPEERNPRNYEEAVGQMRDFCHERGEWLDEHIEIVQQYSHLSKNKKFNH